MMVSGRVSLEDESGHGGCRCLYYFSYDVSSYMYALVNHLRSEMPTYCITIARKLSDQWKWTRDETEVASARVHTM